LRTLDLAAKLAQQGATAAGGIAEEFNALIASEIRNWKEIGAR